MDKNRGEIEAAEKGMFFNGVWERESEIVHV